MFWTKIIMQNNYYLYFFCFWQEYRILRTCQCKAVSQSIENLEVKLYALLQKASTERVLYEKYFLILFEIF